MGILFELTGERGKKKNDTEFSGLIVMENCYYIATFVIIANGIICCSRIDKGKYFGIVRKRIWAVMVLCDEQCARERQRRLPYDFLG